jgi:hypothetical protein
MIRYGLACAEAHAFESWFPSGEAFELQRDRGLVSCPFCGSTAVEKQIMAPAVARTDRGVRADRMAAASPSPEPERSPEGPPPAPPVPQPVALLSEREQAMRAMLRAVREHVVKTAEHVGERFPDEARKMHHGEIEHRSIYGEANPAEVRALLEEGVEIHPLPPVPDERN